MVLEIINSCLTRNLHNNPHLIYSLLYQREVFEPYRSHPSLMDLVQNIETVRMCIWTLVLNHSCLFSVDACTCMCMCVYSLSTVLSVIKHMCLLTSGTSKGCNEVLKLKAMVLKYEGCLKTGEYLTLRTLKKQLSFVTYSLLQIFRWTKVEFHAYMKSER